MNESRIAWSLTIFAGTKDRKSILGLHVLCHKPSGVPAAVEPVVARISEKSASANENVWGRLGIEVSVGGQLLNFY